jgi:small subunit ribosomal protein S21
MEVTVQGSFEESLIAFKKLVGRSGILQELRLRRYYEKPCDKRNRKIRQNQERKRRRERKRLDNDT